MRKILFLFVIIFLSLQEVNAQNVKGILIAGTNISQIDGDEIKGYKHWGFNGGVGGMLALGYESPWNIGMEVLFSQKGSRQRNGYTGDIVYATTLSYAEVPLMLHFEDKHGGFTFGAGLSYGQLIDTKEETNKFYTDTTTTFQKQDISALIDIRFRIWKQLKFNFRFEYSLMPVRKDWRFVSTEGIGKEWFQNAYNNTLTFRLLWVFNEKEQPKYRRRR